MKQFAKLYYCGHYQMALFIFILKAMDFGVWVMKGLFAIPDEVGGVRGGNGGGGDQSMAVNVS